MIIVNSYLFHQFCSSVRNIIVEMITPLPIQVTVVMPVVAPIMKISQCQEMGANVIVHGATIAEV